jgi:hypothetical protein
MSLFKREPRFLRRTLALSIPIPQLWTAYGQTDGC